MHGMTEYNFPALYYVAENNAIYVCNVESNIVKSKTALNVVLEIVFLFVFLYDRDSCKTTVYSFLLDLC